MPAIQKLSGSSVTAWEAPLLLTHTQCMHTHTHSACQFSDVNTGSTLCYPHLLFLWILTWPLVFSSSYIASFGFLPTPWLAQCTQTSIFISNNIVFSVSAFDPKSLFWTDKRGRVINKARERWNQDDRRWKSQMNPAPFIRRLRAALSVHYFYKLIWMQIGQSSQDLSHDSQCQSLEPKHRPLSSQRRLLWKLLSL